MISMGEASSWSRFSPKKMAGVCKFFWQRGFGRERGGFVLAATKNFFTGCGCGGAVEVWLLVG